MGDKQDGHSLFLPDALYQLKYLCLYSHIEGCCRLVSYKQAGSQAIAIAIITRCLIPRTSGEDIPSLLSQGRYSNHPQQFDASVHRVFSG